jgi:hypothetical protein
MIYLTPTLAIVDVHAICSREYATLIPRAPTEQEEVGEAEAEYAALSGAKRYDNVINQWKYLVLMGAV